MFRWILEVIGEPKMATTQGMPSETSTRESRARTLGRSHADLVTASRKRAAGKGDGKNDGTLPKPLEETPVKTGPDRKLAVTHEFH